LDEGFGFSIARLRQKLKAKWWISRVECENTKYFCLQRLITRAARDVSFSASASAPERELSPPTKLASKSTSLHLKTESFFPSVLERNNGLGELRIRVCQLINLQLTPTDNV
jgi:hypothetical protein